MNQKNKLTIQKFPNNEQIDFLFLDEVKEIENFNTTDAFLSTYSLDMSFHKNQDQKENLRINLYGEQMRVI